MRNHRNLVFAIHRMTHEIAVALERADLGVNQPEAHILAHLVQNGDSSVAEIHRTFGHKRSTLTSVLDRLEARELIRREVHPQDRRSFVINLTDAGARVARDVHAWLQHLEANVSARLTDQQLAGFRALSDAVHAATSAD